MYVTRRIRNSRVDKIVEAFRRIDIVMNNAGTIFRAPAEEHSMESWYKARAPVGHRGYPDCRSTTGGFLQCRRVSRTRLADHADGKSHEEKVYTELARAAAMSVRTCVSGSSELFNNLY